MNKDKSMNDKACNILKKQYEKVFSTPLNDLIVQNPDEFLNPPTITSVWIAIISMYIFVLMMAVN